MGKAIYAAPAAVFVMMAGLLAWSLTNDPSEVPTAFEGKPVPAFDLPPIDDQTPGLATADLANGKISIINIFGSYCVPCRAEHALLTEIASWDGIAVYGIAYKDKPEMARAFLDELGNPYERIGYDPDGRVGIDLGVYGVPETFVVAPDGTIRGKIIGPMYPKDLARDGQIRSLVESLRP